MSENGSGNLSLVKKLAEAGAAIGWIEKSGRNTFHNYNYATEADLVSALRGELFKRNVFIFPSTLAVERNVIIVRSMKNGQLNERETALTNVMVRWTFVDGDTNETMQCDMPGCGEDSGDKGVYKAMTGSEKYLLMKAFLIPTGDDPEKDTEPEKKEAWDRGAQASQAVAQQKIADHQAKDSGAVHPKGESIEFVPTDAGMCLLKGDNGVVILRAEAPENAQALMVKLSTGWAVPMEKALSFYKLAQRHKIMVSVSNDDFKAIEAASVATMAAPNAEVPPMTEGYEATDDDIPASMRADSRPILKSVATRYKADPINPKDDTKGKRWLDVFWGDKKCSCWIPELWDELTSNQGKPAMFTLDAKGKNYIMGIRSVGDHFYDEDQTVRA